MSNALNIQPTGALDFLSLGALVHRLDPGIVPFRKAHECQIHVSGGEYNVAANLADCFRLQTGIATAMVNYGIGELVASLWGEGFILLIDSSHRRWVLVTLVLALLALGCYVWLTYRVPGGLTGGSIAGLAMK